MVYSLGLKSLAILVICSYINLTDANDLASDGSTTVSAITTDISTSSFLSPTTTPSTTPSITSDVSASSPASPTESGGIGGSSGGGSTIPSSSAASLDSSYSLATSTIPATASTSGGLVPTSTASSNSTFNSTAAIAATKLPLTPEITPGFGVAGVFLILSGAVYAMLGIRYKYLHVFLSAAYLTSLAVAILILYVMSLPVSNSVQGAYVTAVAVSGIIVGGGALVLVEMLQGLGCLLGGFTFSMWLLVLKPGGLLTSRGGRVGFIAGVTLAGFSTSFSQLTRPYGLIVCISFSGSTALILGIDCFSRAGLKEFWVYLWNINNDLWALGTSTYPLTKGIYAEIAGIIVFSIVGIISQTNLWKIIKERHQRRVAERLEDDKAREEEEANIGRGIESLNTRERDEWEAAHGDKDEVGVLPSERDSGVGDMDSQKKGPVSTVTSVLHPDEDEIEMAQIPQPAPMTQPLPTAPDCDDQDGVSTVPDAEDSQPESKVDEDENLIINSPSPPSRASTEQLKNEEASSLKGLDLENQPVDNRSATCEADPSVDAEELHQVSDNTDFPLPMLKSQTSNGPPSIGPSSSQADSELSLSQGSPHGRPQDGISSRASQLPLQPEPSQESHDDQDVPIHSSLSLKSSGASEPAIEENSSPLSRPVLESKRSSLVPFGGNTLMGKRDSMIRSKTTYSGTSFALESTPRLPTPHLEDAAPQQRSSSRGSVIYRDYGLPSASPTLDDDMPLSARRSLLRLPSAPPSPIQGHHPYSGPSPIAREQQLASWRSSMQQERRSSIKPNEVIERQRSALWQEKRVEGQRKAHEQRKKEEKEDAFDQSMRRGPMLDAHREAMRKMQAIANKHRPSQSREGHVPTASQAAPSTVRADSSTVTPANAPTTSFNPRIPSPTLQPPYPSPSFVHHSAISPEPQVRITPPTRWSLRSAFTGGNHVTTPFRSRAGTAGSASSTRPRRTSGARLWNPTNSTPRTYPKSPPRQRATTRRRNRSAVEEASVIAIPLSHPAIGSLGQEGGAPGEYPLLTLPEQRQKRHSASTRASLQVERRGSSQTNRISLPRSVSIDISRRGSGEPNLDKGKGKAVEGDDIAGEKPGISQELIAPVSGISFDKGKGRASMSNDLEHGPSPQTPYNRGGTSEIPANASRTSLPEGIGPALSSNNTSIIGSDGPAPNPAEEWGPQHPCFPHMNPHVPLSSPLYQTTRIIRIRRDWMVEGDLAPTFSNLYPEILDPAGVSEQDFRKLVEKINGELVPAFNPWGVRNMFDAAMGLLTGWVWDDMGFTAVKSRLRNVEKHLEDWNKEMESRSKDGPGSAPMIVPLRRTGYMNLDIQVPDPEISYPTASDADRTDTGVSAPTQ